MLNKDGKTGLEVTHGKCKNAQVIKLMSTTDEEKKLTAEERRLLVNIVVVLVFAGSVALIGGSVLFALGHYNWIPLSVVVAILSFWIAGAVSSTLRARRK